MEGQTLKLKPTIMLKKTKFLGLMIIVFAVMSSCGLFSCTTNEVTISEDDDGEWRIYDNNGNNQGVWTVEEDTEITWIVTGSDMTFSFPEILNTYFRYEPGLFSEVDSSFTASDGTMEFRYLQTIEEGDSLNLRVLDLQKAVTDTIDYDIYVIDAQKFVVGNSPPYLIIQRSQ